jgi:YesN/AraC family two-component response regulator
VQPTLWRILVEHSIDILFLDIQMPGLSGLELAQKLKQLSRAAADRFCNGFY